jgi:hypothetical protein
MCAARKKNCGSDLAHADFDGGSDAGAGRTASAGVFIRSVGAFQRSSGLVHSFCDDAHVVDESEQSSFDGLELVQVSPENPHPDGEQSRIGETPDP